MTLLQWSPMRSLLDSDDMFKMFDQLLPRETPGWRPRVDIMREDGTLVLRADLPGMKAEDIDIRVEGNALVLEGTRDIEHTAEDSAWYIRERFHGAFRRRVVLPEGVDAAGIEADYTDGTLTVRMPLPAALDTRPRKIPVKTD